MSSPPSLVSEVNFYVQKLTPDAFERWESRASWLQFVDNRSRREAEIESIRRILRDYVLALALGISEKPYPPIWKVMSYCK